MSRVDDLTKASRSYARAWKEFIEGYEKNPSRLYCFFEGQDDPKYYNPRIETIVFNDQEQDQLENLWCEGKDNVITLLNLIREDKRFSNAWVAFFIDKDFDNLEDLPSDERMYITCCYSVENLYLSTASLKKIFRDEFCLSKDDPDFEKTVKLFCERLEDFNTSSDELNAWIFLQKEERKKLGLSSKLGLSGIKPRNLFSISLGRVIKTYLISDLESKLLPNLLIDEVRVLVQVETFQKVNRTEAYRGKYLIYFLERLLKLLADDRNSKDNQQHFSRRSRVTLQLSTNILSELSQYAETPACLRQFLQSLAARRPVQLTLNV